MAKTNNHGTVGSVQTLADFSQSRIMNASMPEENSLGRLCVLKFRSVGYASLASFGLIGRFAAGIGFSFGLLTSSSVAESLPRTLDVLLENHCLDCHDDVEMKGGLDLFSLDWNLADPHLADIWVKVHDRLASGEMPPKKKSRLEPEERRKAVSELAASIVGIQDAYAAREGRSVSRRVNRFEYENILRDILHDPTLKVADQLPLDGEVHGFPKVGSALDVSHVQVDSYLDVAEFALRRALEFTAEKPEPTTNRYYAREQARMWAGKGNPGWARFALALEGLEINDYYSFSKRGFDPAQEAQPPEETSTAIFRGAYTPFYYGFEKFKALVRGEINSFMGFEILTMGDRDEGGVPKPSTRSCFAWHKDALGYAESMAQRSEVNYIPEKTSFLVSSMFSAGAVAIDDEGIVKISCTE